MLDISVAGGGAPLPHASDTLRLDSDKDDKPMKLSNVLLGLTGCFFAASLSGCFVVTSDNPSPPATGSLTVDITLAGAPTTDPANSCDYFKVDGLSVEIDQGSSVVKTVNTDCAGNAGVTVLDLDPGAYTVRASLLEGSNVVSDVLVVDDLNVTSNFDTHVKIDFPSSSIK